MTGIHVAILLFIALQLVIGIWVGRKTKNVEDYLVAGRKLGFPLAFISIFATWFGAESCVSAAGSAHRDGFSWSSPEPFGFGVALVLMGFFFAGALWKAKITTLADLFRSRYSPGIEKMAALLMTPTSLFWAAAQILAFGQILSAAFGFDLTLAITLSTLVVIIYTLIGGLLADVWTDALQGFILILSLGIMFVTIFFQHGSELVKATSSVFLPPEPAQDSSFSLFEFVEIWAIYICGSVVAQEIISRICASKSYTVSVRSTQFAGLFYILIGIIPLSLGLAGKVLIPDLAESDQILTHIAQEYLPPFVFVLFAGALVSVILSTVDSALLAASSLVSQNLLAPIFGNLTPKQNLALTRGTVVFFGIISCLLAFWGENVFDLVIEASSFGTSGIFIILVFGLFTKFGGKVAACSSLISGIITYFLGAYVLDWPTPYLWSVLVAFTSFSIFGFLEKKLTVK